jgi:hypothetical protein
MRIGCSSHGESGRGSRFIDVQKNKRQKTSNATSLVIYGINLIGHKSRQLFITRANFTMEDMDIHTQAYPDALQLLAKAYSLL